MITLIYGDPGTGKTREIFRRLSEDAAAGRTSYLLVPEQATLDTERASVEMLPASSQLSCEILNFSRLANRVFRKYGGLCYNYANETVRSVVMQRALKKCAPLLSEYGNVALRDASFPSSMLNTLSEFRRSGYDAEDISDAAAEIRNTSAGRKLSDIATAASVYYELLGESFADPEDDMSKLRDVLAEHDFFSGANVYLDSFQSLTGAEYAVLAEIMRQADNTAITFSLSSRDSRAVDSLSQRRMSDTVRKTASALSLPSETLVLTEAFRYVSEPLKLLSSSLWQLDRPLSPIPADGSVTFIRANDEYSECEETAAVVRSLMESGYRCREIAVIPRDGNRYRGIIEPELEKAGIPYYFAEKRPVSNTAPARLILSALKIFTSGWQREDLISYVRTGLCGISRRDADIFENYCAQWRINGKGFLSDGDWTMNPDGYVPALSERAAAILSTVNEVKKRLVPVLTDYMYSLKKSVKAADMCRATYGFIEKLGVPDAMAGLAKEALLLGNVREASESLRISDCLCDVLDSVYSAFGDDSAPDISQFRSALSTAFEKTEIGSLPDSPDSVLIGSADMVRAEGVKCVILPGVYDGSFPASVTQHGLLSESDREDLLKHSIELSSDTRQAASDELFYVRRALSFASEKLIVFTRGKSKPSVVCERISTLLGGISAVSAGSDPISRINSRENALEYLRALDGTPEGAALKEALTLKYPGLAPESGIPLDASGDYIDPDISSRLFGKRLELTQSRIEKYVSCPFSYACRYVLKLGENESASFGASDTGTFVHYIFEKLLLFVFTENRGVFPDKEEKDRLIEKLVGDYLSGIAPDGSVQRTVRLRHRIDRMCRLACSLTDDLLCELRDTDFIPEYFEVKIGRGGLPPLEFTSDDGSSVFLTGKADRIDVYRKDGKTYLKVVDYKSGDKKFSLSDIANGENLQLLLYLFSASQTGSPLSGDGGSEPIPAEITYLSTYMPKLKLPLNSDRSDIDREISQKIKRTGLILNDPEIMSAQSRSGNAHYLPSNTDSRIDETKFSELKELLGGVLSEIAGNLRRGKATATPKTRAESCRYCPYTNICRHRDSTTGDENETD